MLFVFAAIGSAQETHLVGLPTGIGNELQDLLWYQIPSSYSPEVPTPLLMGWHQLGGSELEFANVTSFDRECEMRGWIAVSMKGITNTNWTNQLAQVCAVSALEYIDSLYNIDRSRIYMVGASMGGGSGMIFSNNHLDPEGYMVAATASISGIMDDMRRFDEQGYNYSMTSAFGGTSGEVPFVYQRNSPAYFKDGRFSMHWNLKHVPVNLTVGLDDYPWVYHARDMYELLVPLVDTVYFEQTSTMGHGWNVANDSLICEWLSNFTLNDNPEDITISADEPGVYYWTEVLEQLAVDTFSQYNAEYDVSLNYFHLEIKQKLGGIAMNLAYMGLNTTTNLEFDIDSEQNEGCEIVLRDITSSPVEFLRDGNPFTQWTYSAVNEEIIFSTTGNHSYLLVMNNISGGEEKTSKKMSGRINIDSDFGINSLEFDLDLIRGGEISMFDVLGRRVFRQTLGPDLQDNINIRGLNLTSGIYFLRMVKFGKQQTNKIILIK